MCIYIIYLLYVQTCIHLHYMYSFWVGTNNRGRVKIRSWPTHPIETWQWFPGCKPSTIVHQADIDSHQIVILPQEVWVITTSTNCWVFHESPLWLTRGLEGVVIPNLFSRSGPGMTGLPCPWLRLIHSWCLPPKLETSSANRTSHVPGLSESLGVFCSATVHAAATDSSPREFGSRPTVCELEAMVHFVRWFTYSKWWCSSSQTATNNQRLRTRCLVSQASCISCISYVKLIISSYIRLYLIHSSTIFPWYSNGLVLPHHHQPLRLLSRAFQNSISSSGPLFSPSLAESFGGLWPQWRMALNGWAATEKSPTDHFL